ncbi:MAG: proline--tRNA ligase [Candidatus Hydrogenedentales bacterium]
MRMSHLVGTRFKERPAEATIESHALLLRGGYARQVANGIYSLLPPGLRVVRKIERIIREEMDRIGGQEVLMPLVQPRELWDESGRYTSVGSELARFKDRTGHDMVLAMTHEEGVVHLCRNEVNSHNQLPFMVYQIQTKFRDEPRSRGGLIRVREFTMKDAYSFHTSQEDLEQYYMVCYKAYERIFARAGLPQVVAVASDTGMMGGKVAHEFILLTEIGEDTIVTSDGSDYRANLEVAEGVVEGFKEEPKPLEKVHTPAKKTIEDVAAFVGVPTRQTAKVVFYEADSQGLPVLALIRGDRDVSEMKLSKIIQNMPVAAQDSLIKAGGAEPGYASPMGLDPKRWRILVDHTVRDSSNLVTGANEADYHYINFNLERDLPGHETVDICVAQPNDGSPDGKGKLDFQRGIEVGNIFQLGTKYSTSMGMTYNDEQGKSCVPIMGCYGIGVGRLMSSIMEIHRDQYGPKWPMSVAPWQVHLNALKLNVDTVKSVSDKIYSELSEIGLEVLYDDRDARPGVQFADADLLGIPIRLIVSERNLANGQVEWKRRDTGESGTISVEEVSAAAKKWVAEAIAIIDSNAASK